MKKQSGLHPFLYLPSHLLLLQLHALQEENEEPLGKTSTLRDSFIHQAIKMLDSLPLFIFYISCTLLFAPEIWGKHYFSFLSCTYGRFDSNVDFTQVPFVGKIVHLHVSWAEMKFNMGNPPQGNNPILYRTKKRLQTFSIWRTNHFVGLGSLVKTMDVTFCLFIWKEWSPNHINRKHIVINPYCKLY